MNRSLKEFRDEYQRLLLDFLWRQWSSVGIAGDTRPADKWIVDLEALLILSCTVARHDPRLFDEILDWMQTNGRLINILRLKRILKTEQFSGAPILAAIAGLLAKGADAPKWRLLAGAEKPGTSDDGLFLKDDGTPLPVLGDPEPRFARYGWRRGPLELRGYSQEFRPMAEASLVLQLRALFGINVRCEILLYLLTHDTAHPSQIAREAYYFDRAVQGTLVEMSRSGVIQIRATNREKHYWMKREDWMNLLGRGKHPLPGWVTWPAFFSALEHVWIRLNDPRLLQADRLLQASELRQLMVEVLPSFQKSGLDRGLSDHRQHLGEGYLPLFMADMKRLLE